jgi:hypothetical protein
MKSAWILAVIVGVAAAASAQEPTAADVAKLKMKMAAEADIRSKIAIEAKVTPGAPYSAEAINESTQMLVDGNRIVQRSVTRVYRDGEGRTRREEVTESGEVLSVSIVDPVAHASYVLDPKTRTAYRGVMMIARTAAPNGPPVIVGLSDEAKRKIELAQGADREKLLAEADMKMRTAPPLPPPPPPPGYQGELMSAATPPTKEDLGRQTVEGVPASGSRMTWTIAAGAIGNLQPIRIVSEQWFSPDLQLLVLTKHNDPRTGENVYRLQNIVRAEPDRSFFSVPPDYTLKESGIRKE